MREQTDSTLSFIYRYIHDVDMCVYYRFETCGCITALTSNSSIMEQTKSHSNNAIDARPVGPRTQIARVSRDVTVEEGQTLPRTSLKRNCDILYAPDIANTHYPENGWLGAYSKRSQFVQRRGIPQ